LTQPKAHLTRPTPTFEQVWESRKATEADLKWIAPRLATSSQDEIAALTRFVPLSFLLRDMDRKAVIVERSNPTRPVVVFDLNLNPDDQTAVFWSAMTDGAAATQDHWGFTEYANCFLAHANKLYPSITTLVDARNEEQIAFLERVGFIRTEELPKHGRNEIKFFVYTRLIGDTSDAYGQPIQASLAQPTLR
jgi:hypothetical protein